MMNAIAIDDEPLALKVIQSHCEKTGFITLQKLFTQPTEALKYLRKYPVDLLFVDIQMPSMNGITLVKAIQQNTMIIFTTAFSEYAVVSYELNAIDYLLKPINFKRFSQAVDKANEYYNYISKQNHAEDKYVFIRADYSLVKIPLADILYIEGLADYIKVFIKGRKTVVARMTMNDMLEKLPSKDFVRVHRSFILPFNRIESYRANMIVLPEREIPIGKTYLKDFNSRIDLR
jgi:DNA-binding LytR/AlgR family response regulator